MPAAYRWARRGYQAELVVIGLGVDGMHQADEWVFRTGIWFGGHGHGILDAAVVQGHVEPLVAGIEHEAVGVGRTQIGIAALIYIFNCYYMLYDTIIF